MLMASADVEAAVLEGRLASPVAAKAAVDAAALLVGAMPTALAADLSVYESLQRLACDVETAIAAADSVLGLVGREESPVDRE